MEAFPHHYRASAAAQAEGLVSVGSPGLPELATAAPAAFGGPGDRWSPETLLLASVADCFILTFRAIARASKLEWQGLVCRVEGVLDRVDGTTRFTELRIHAELDLPAGGDAERGRRLLEKAERGCLVTNSLRAESKLETDVRVAS
jgi:organic hydroperoxide reductase OsmC/OhrA